jgi:molybdopterin-binding protein
VKGSARVQLKNLWVDLAEFHLREIDLDIAPGEYFVILGPTGAGKTVLLEAVAGLQQLQEGRILINGEDVTHTPPEQRGIGFVYQDYMLFPHMSVSDNIAFGLKMRHMDRQTIAAQVAEISQLLGISHLLHRKPGTLSGGEQQRAALARALVVGPRLLLLDEPLSALDPETREGLQRELARLHQELGTTTVHVTHDFEEAVALGDRIAVINDGQVIQVGSSEEVFRKPNSEFVARFVGVRNIFQGAIRIQERGQKVLCLDEIDLAVLTDLEGPAHGSIRPEDIVLSRAPLRSSARNSFGGHIVSIVDRGAVVYVTVEVPPNFICAITKRSLEEMELNEGQEIHIAFKASAIHVF